MKKTCVAFAFLLSLCLTVSGWGTQEFKGNVSGSATNLSGTPALPNGTTVTTQAAGSNDTKIATDAYVDAKVVDSINDGTTGIAPSQNAVFDALALKAPLLNPIFTGTLTAPIITSGQYSGYVSSTNPYVFLTGLGASTSYLISVFSNYSNVDLYCISYVFIEPNGAIRIHELSSSGHQIGTPGTGQLQITSTSGSTPVFVSVIQLH